MIDYASRDEDKFSTSHYIFTLLFFFYSVLLQKLQQKSVSFQDKDTVRQYKDASVIIVVVISCGRTYDRKRVRIDLLIRSY